MAYDPNGLSIIGYANGFTLWHYATPDPDIAQRAYFAPAADLFRTGDFILANVGPPREARHGFFAVLSADRRAVQVGALTRMAPAPSAAREQS